jgi:hypothetical protein
MNGSTGSISFREIRLAGVVEAPKLVGYHLVAFVVGMRSVLTPALVTEAYFGAVKVDRELKEVCTSGPVGTGRHQATYMQESAT